jgi:hypothetical protein
VTTLGCRSNQHREAQRCCSSTTPWSSRAGTCSSPTPSASAACAPGREDRQARCPRPGRTYPSRARPGDLASHPRRAGGLRAGQVPAPPRPRPDGAQEPDPRSAHHVRPCVADGRPGRRRGPQAARLAALARTVAHEPAREPGGPRRSDRVNRGARRGRALIGVPDDPLTRFGACEWCPRAWRATCPAGWQVAIPLGR